jgi:hypothetical protein
MYSKTLLKKIFFCLSYFIFLASTHYQLLAQAITRFHATYKSGQVFLQWENNPSQIITYNIYKSRFPILHGNQLPLCRYLGFTFDSSAYNRQFSLAADTPKFFRLDSNAAPLTVDSGLFVTTCDSLGNFYYAITTVTSGVEDTSIISGENSIQNPVHEFIAEPQPIYQGRTMGNFDTPVDVYAFFVCNLSTTFFPPMTNVGSLPVNFSLFDEGNTSPHQLVMKLPGGGGTFLSDIGGDQLSDEWRICMDDNLPNDDNAIWFGYHEGFNIFGTKQQLPQSGLNYDYLYNQLNYVINWSIHHLPVDSNSIYFDGTSGGAAGALFASSFMPDHIAASRMVVPKVDLSFLNDPDPNNDFNAGRPGRFRIDTLLGTVSLNLPTNVGYRTYDVLNDCWLLHQHREENFPVMFMVSGKHDTVVGWAEKIPFYDSVNSNKVGGFYFWDMRIHTGDGASWPMNVNLFRYHANKSYPAFSNCSVNNNPGDGHYFVGDSVGSINGFMDWLDNMKDSTNSYSIALGMSDEQTYFNMIPAPDSCTADVTLRRLQNFKPQAGDLILWTNSVNGDTIQSGSLTFDGTLLTISGVKIFKNGSMLKLSDETVSGIPGEKKINSIKIFPNPALQHFQVSIQSNEGGLLQLWDVSGKLVLEKYEAGFSNAEINLKKPLPAGLYEMKILQPKKTWIGKLEITGSYPK